MSRNRVRKFNLDLHMDPSNVVFSMFTAEEIRTLSVTKIYTPLTFNSLGNPLPGGLYDPSLGPVGEKSDPCQTCFNNILGCPGHIGHIELPLPVVNPLFYNIIRSLLKITCVTCFRLQISDHVNRLLVLQLKLIDRGYLVEAQNLDQYMNVEPGDKENYPADLLKQYDELVEQSNLVERNKNSEGIRSNFISTIIKQIQVKKKCIHCREHLIKITGLHHKLMIEVFDKEKNESLNTSRFVRQSMTLLFPGDCKEYFRQLWYQEKELLQEVIAVLKASSSDPFPTDVLFLDVIAVPPPNVRPVNYMNNRLIEHPQTDIYKAILNSCSVVRAILQCVQNEPNILETTQVVYNNSAGQTGIEKLNNAWQQLQANVDHLMDIEINKITGSVSGQGLKQIMEKKEGIIRMHMMGKRVNFAARSVITPDPNLNIDEIGVPEAFAKKLSYPVPVTSWNVTELRKMVMNGPNVHPGAVMVENEDGSLIKIPNDEVTKKESIAKRLLTPSEGGKQGVKIVHRHLCNGDIMLLNRQPTLHKPSIMAHKARILPGEKTLRLHYANCKAYNADFDGDEMNAHFPQNELARSEGYNLVNVCNQYLVPKDGTPLSGLIQDHVISGVRLSMRGRFFTKEDYQMLVYSALVHIQGDIKILPPAIIKPVNLWSGKQVISTLIINNIPKKSIPLTLKSTAKIPANAWQSESPRHWLAGGTYFKNPNEMTEAEVIIQKGELLSGVLDKTHYGATPYGLVHCMYELYGGSWSNKLLSSFAKLFTSFLQREGFTLGVHDILVLKSADKKRTNIIAETRQIGPRTSAEAVNLSTDADAEELTEAVELAHSSNPKFRNVIDRKYKQALDNYTNEINKTCLPAGLLCKFPQNNLQLMVQSGAKGSTVNTMQISCLLGQIELEGKRPPVMISGKSLPSFPAYEPSPRAGGFIDGRFMTGIQPQEFFFHCMAGREGLIDTAVKTSRSGYLQRCLIKHLEGLTVKYDLTVRDSDNSVIQFLYGEDGMDISKVQFLNKKSIPFLNDNSDIILDKKVVQKFYEEGVPDELLQTMKQLKRWKKKYGNPLEKDRVSAFAQYSRKYLPDEDSMDTANKKSKMTGRTRLTKKVIKMWREIPKEDKEKLKAKLKTMCPDPLTSQYQPDHYFGVLNENLENLMKDYKKTKNVNEEFEDMIKYKAMTTLCEPGEPVGLLAAQSVGEPSTQMTLNTFHFAGRGEMNVTLGIPRLKEILMTASKEIKTPCMDIPFKESISEHFSETERLRKRLIRVTIFEVLKNVQIHRILTDGKFRRQKYSIKFEFLPHSAYKNDFCVKPKGIIKYMEQKFCPSLMRAIIKSSRSKQTVVIDEGEKSKRKKKNNDEEEEQTTRKPNYKTFGEDYATSDEDEGIADDEDATNARKRSRKNDNQNYDVSEDESNEKSEEDEADEELNETKPAENDNENDANTDTGVEGFTFDEKGHLWCKYVFMLGMAFTRVNLPEVIKVLAEKSVIWETPNIKRAITYKNNDGALVLKTDGINIVEMFKYNNLLDLNKLYSNDVHCIAQTYGIEAASRVIVKEVQNVFNVYGITVDPRHLLLIADYMTYDGTFQPLSRSGLETSVSPLQQMSYESSLTFLRQATIKGMQDGLNSPSSRLMLGQPCGTGTGTVSLLNTFSHVAFG